MGRSLGGSGNGRMVAEVGKKVINTVMSEQLWLAQLLWTMYFTYTLLPQTLDTNLKFILHLYYSILFVVVFTVLMQFLLLHEINHC